MTAAEARQRAAVAVLNRMRDIEGSITYIGNLSVLAGTTPEQAEADQEMVLTELRLIETWLRRRAVGGDKILTRQMERPTGGKVGMSPKQARKMGIPDGTKPKP